jgi:hypothetical protein
MLRAGRFARERRVVREHGGGCSVMGWSVPRVLACAVGAGSAGVGLFQYSAPVAAASRWGIDPGTDPTSAIMMRGAGARDCLTGSALLYSAVRGGDYRPWLAMRAAADAADGLAGGLSLRAGTGFSRQTRTTRSAFLLAGAELVLWLVSGGDQPSRARMTPG